MTALRKLYFILENQEHFADFVQVMQITDSNMSDKTEPTVSTFTLYKNPRRKYTECRKKVFVTLRC